MTGLHTNYYQILGVDPESSSEEIKRAFRRRAKEIHPDVTSKGGSNTLEQMQLLIRAYEVLGNPSRREDYDRIRGVHAEKYHFDYREFLRSRADDPASQSKLIFFDLLHQHEDDAVKLYELMCSRDDFDLSGNLDREDFMDCAFLLAEEFEEREDFLKAFDLLVIIVEYEREKPYFRHFIAEVNDRLRRLVNVRFPGNIQQNDYVACLERLVELDLSRKETAYYLLKIAEHYTDNARFDLAERYLHKGLALDSNVAGARKVRQKLERSSYA